MTKILVIDDDRGVRHIVRQGLNDHMGFKVVSAADGNTGLEMVRDEKPDVCLLDVFLPEHHGLELFQKIKSLDSRIPVIFITGDRSSETAIEAMRAGAFDYLAKPLNILQLRDLAQSAAKARALMDQPVALPVGEALVDGEQFIGNSKAMIEVFKDIGRVAAQNVTVLVRGESGSGKELVARALVNHSDRRDEKFVAVNCAAIPDQLLESELFGHEKGAFTGAEKKRIGRFEQCDGGTIFLDEIGDMSPVVQGKVLRLLQEQRFERVGGNELVTTNVRVVAATNRPLEEMVEQDEFREDLLYRLNSFTIKLPPLRERRDDIPALLEYFLLRAKSEMNRPELSGISPKALEMLENYDWPGNVRQLQSVVRQSLLNTTGTVISELNLPDFVQYGPERLSSDTAAPQEPAPVSKPRASDASFHTADSVPDKDSMATEHATPNTDESGIQNEDSTSAADEFVISQFIDERMANGSNDLYNEALEELERRLFQKVLEHTGGNQSKTAEILGITRGKVRDRIAQFDIQLDRQVSVGKRG